MDKFVSDEHAADTTVSRPITERSRMTGVERKRSVAPGEGRLDRSLASRTLDTGAIVASVVTGLAITTMLIILGISTGLVAGNEGTDAEGLVGILSGVGAWAVVAMIIGSFAGSFLGGRLARWLDRGSLSYHAIVSWGLATLLSVLLACMVALAISSTATSAATSAAAADQVTGGEATEGADATANQAAANDGSAGTTAQNTETTADEAADDTADALGGAGVALTLGMLLTLAASFAGWWVGSRKRLTDFEREDADGRVVAG